MNLFVHEGINREIFKNPSIPQNPQNRSENPGNSTLTWEETVTDFIAMEIFSMASIKQNSLNESEGMF